MPLDEGILEYDLFLLLIGFHFWSSKIAFMDKWSIQYQFFCLWSYFCSGFESFETFFSGHPFNHWSVHQFYITFWFCCKGYKNQRYIYIIYIYTNACVSYFLNLTSFPSVQKGKWTLFNFCDGFPLWKLQKICPSRGLAARQHHIMKEETWWNAKVN